jgi:cytochrome P450
MSVALADRIAAATLLYPRSVTPAARPLPVHRFLFQFVRNPLRIVPEAAYHQPMVVRRRDSLSAKAAWITDPRLIEEVLVHKAGEVCKSAVEKQVLARSAGDGILTSDGHLWRWQRRTMAPLFRPADIQSYVPVMAQAGEEQLARWRESGSGWKAVDDAMTETTFVVIARTMLAGGEAAETESIKRNTERFLSHVSWEIAYALMNVPRWFPHPGSLRMYRAARQQRASVKSLIDRRRAEIAESGTEHHDLLARLLSARDPESGDPMAEPQLINNLLTLLAAGHETTAKALTWTLYLLARTPEWQSIIREEVREVAGGEPLTPNHLPRLVLTQQVLKESMRLYPPAPSISRVFTHPVTLNGETFQPGDMAIFPIFCIHRHRKLWDDPDRFDPMRFSPEREKNYPRTQYMPFGAGPRICIGNTFAMMEGTAILATLVRGAQFDWDGKWEPEPISRVTLRPKGGMRLLVSLL